MMPLALGPVTAAVVSCLFGCNPAAIAPSSAPVEAASPAPSAVGPSVPPAEPWTFGAIEALSTRIEKQIIFQRGERPEAKVYGSANSYEVVVAGKAYGLHWRQADKFKTLKVGDTVNLHPSGWYACVEGGECRALYNVYKSSRPQAPLLTP